MKRTLLIILRAIATRSKISDQPNLSFANNGRGAFATFATALIFFLTSQLVNAQTIIPDPDFNQEDTGSGLGHGSSRELMGIAALPDGKSLIAGYGDATTTYNGELLRGISRLNEDGTLDETFNPGGAGIVDGYVQSMIVTDDKIILGGYFTSYNGEPFKYLVRLNMDGTIDETFNPGTGPNNGVQSMVLQPDGKTIIAGFFTTYDGVAKKKMARINTDGTLDTSFDPGTGADSDVLNMFVRSDGKILIAGYFTSFNSTPIYHLACLNSNGSLDTGFQSGLDDEEFGRVNDMAEDASGKVIIVGSFDTYHGEDRQHFARINNDGSIDLTFDPEGFGVNGQVEQIVVKADNNIMIAGSFSGYNFDSQKYIALVDAAGALVTTFDPGSGTNSSIRLFSLFSDERILISGGFSTINNTFAGKVMRLLSDGSHDTSFNPSSTMKGPSASLSQILELPDEKLLVGGYFNTYDAEIKKGLVRLNVDGTLDEAFNVSGSGPNNLVTALCLLNDGKILIGGDFSTYNGVTVNRLARLNSDGTLDGTFNIGTGFNGVIRKIVQQPDGKILVGGGFTTYNGTGIKYLARLEADGVTLDGTFNTGTGPSSIVTDILLEDNGKMVISGWFSSYNGASRKSIARLNADGSVDTDFVVGTGPSSFVNNVAKQLDGKYIVVGDFFYYGGQSRRGIVRLNANGSLDTEFNSGVGFNNAVYGVKILPDSTIFCMGDFTTYKGTTRQYYARLNSDGSLSETLNADEGPNNRFSNLIQLSDGNFLFWGDFTAFNDVGKNRIVKASILQTQSIGGLTAADSKTYGDDDYSLTATASSGLIISYTSSNPEVATVSGSTVTVQGVGETTITASQSGNSNYLAAQSVDQILTITTKTLTLSGLSVAEKIYDGTTDAVLETPGILDGIEAGDDVSLTEGTISFEDKTAGEDKPLTLTGYLLTGGDAANYTLTNANLSGTITPKELTVTTVTVQDKIYDGTNVASVEGGDLVGVVDGDDVSLSGAGEFADKNVGTDKVVSFESLSLGGADAANYTLTKPADQTASISIRPIVVTAEMQTKAYSEVDPTLTYVSDPALFADDVFAGELTREAGEVIGTYAIQLGTLSAGSNYSITFQTADFTIEVKELTITGLAAETREYDGTTDVVITGGALSGIKAGDDVTLTIGTASFQDKTAGEDKLIVFEGYGLAGVDAPKYSLAIPTTVTGIVTQKTTTLTDIVCLDKVYNGNTTGTLSGGTLDGIVTGDDVTFSGGSAQFADKNVGADKAVTITGIVLEGVDAANYTLDAPDATTADITPKPLDVTAFENLKMYGAADPAVFSLLISSSLHSGDALTGRLEREPGEDVGEYQILQGTLTAGPNYAITYHPDIFTITPKTLSATGLTATSRVYDGTTDVEVSEGTLSGVINSDDVTLVAGDPRFFNKKVEANKTVWLYGYALGGEKAGNYSLSLPVVKASITPKPITITGVAASAKVYDGTTSVSLSGGALADVVAGDIVTLSNLVGAFTDKNVNSDIGIDITDFVLSGTDAPNYEVTSFDPVSANITPFPITITIDDQQKVYGSTDPVLTYSTDHDLFSGDMFSGELTRVPGDTPGEYGIFQGTLDAGSNYFVTVVQGSFTITPKLLTLFDVVANDKTYDGTTEVTASGGTLSGVIDGDDVTLSPGTFSLADKTAGENKAVVLVGFTLSGTQASYYELADVADLTVNVSPKEISISDYFASDRTYDGTVDASIEGGVLHGMVDGDEVIISSLTGAFSDKNVGADKTVTIDYVELTGTDAANYVLVQPTDASASITPAQLNVTAIDQSKVYGTSDPVLEYMVDPALFAGDVFTGALTRASGDDAGTYAISQGSLSVSSNYAITFTGAQFVIEPKLLTFFESEAFDKVYDGSTAASVSLNLDLAFQIEFGDDVYLTQGTATFASADVGNNIPVVLENYQLGGADVGNYALETLTLTADITPKELLISAIEIEEKVYDGGTDAVIGQATLTGIIEGDEVYVTGGYGQFWDSNAGENKHVDVYDLELAGADAANYSINSYTTGTATITPMPVIITPLAYTLEKVYGDSEPALYYSSEPDLFISEFTGELSRDAGENVGTYAVTLGTLYAGPNYTLSLAPSSFTIHPKELLIFDLSVEDKVYDGTTTATVNEIFLVGSVGGDEIGITNVQAEFSDRNAGTGYWITLTNYTLTGANAANYVVEVDPFFLIATIYPQVIDITIHEGQNKKYGEVDPVFAYSANPSLFESDTFSGNLSRVAGENIGTYQITQGDLTAGSNYELTFNNVAFEVLPGEITFKDWHLSNKFYDGTTTADFELIAVNGVRTGDDITIVNGVANFIDKNAGENKEVLFSGFEVSGSDAANYTLTTPTQTTATIFPAPITVTASAGLTKAYGESDPEFPFFADPALLGGDEFTGELERAPGETPGDYAITIGSLNAGGNYTIAYIPSTFTIVKANQFIVFDLDFETKTTDDASFSIVATSSSGLDVQLSIIGPATLEGNVVTLTGVTGGVFITATQEGNELYLAAEPVTQSFEVTPVTGIENPDWHKTISAYPNPVNSILTVDGNGVVIESISLSDMNGKNLLTKSNINDVKVSVDVSNIINGKIMLLMIKSKEGVSYRKILVE